MVVKGRSLKPMLLTWIQAENVSNSASFLFLTLLYHPGPQPMGQGNPHAGKVSPPQLILSQNTLMDTEKYASVF